MKKYFILFLLFIGIISVSQAQISKSEMRTDLYFLRDTLPAKHLNLFAKISRSDFEKSIVSLDARIDTLDEEPFFTEIFQIIKAIGDEHTRFRPDLSPYRLPIRFTLFKEGCFVTEAHQSELLLGKLIAINGIDMEEIINRFKKILYDENPSYFDISLPQYLNNTYILKGLGITQTKDSITCTFLNTDHKTISAVLKPDPKAKLRKAPSSTELRAFKGKGIY